jgi:hypothetical protein
MATVYLLKSKHEAWKITLTLVGKKLITGEGESALVQSFPSPAAAKEHLEGLIERRKKEGYWLDSATEVDDAATAHLTDPLAHCFEHDAAAARAKITFQGDKVPPRLCAQIVKRIESTAPYYVQLICDPASPGSAFSKALAGKALPSIKAFIFDTHFQTATRQRENSLGDLADILAALPNLERAFITGSSKLRKTRHSALRELYLLGDPLSPRAVEALGQCSFPALETLALSLCSDDAPGPESAALAALRSIDAQSLHTAHIDGLTDVTRFLDELASAPLPPSLSTLCLGGALEDEDELLRILKERAPALAQLSTLGLPLADDLPAYVEEQAKAILDAVTELDDLEEVFLPDTYLDF